MKPRSKVIHSNRAKGPGVNSPLVIDSAFKYRNKPEVQYPRYFNTPNHQNLSQRLADLEKAEACLLFGSGMAAISTCLFAHLQSGDHAVFSQDLYGGTYNFIISEFPKYGISYTFVAGNSEEDFEKAIASNTKVLYVESPSNPLLRLLKLSSLADLARKHKIISMIDNTFASPVNQNPIAHGFDVVLHSGTKYLGGHSDLCYGAVMSDKQTIDKIHHSAINFGGSLNALDYYLIERSLKTLFIRIKQQNENAMKIAQHLDGHPGISRVFYPGLAHNPFHELAKEQMNGFGGMVSFELKNTKAEHFLDKLEMIQPTVSLGGVESIICSPVETSHAKMPGEERMKAGITDSLLRLSVGIEDSEDLIADIDQALEKSYVLSQEAEVH